MRLKAGPNKPSYYCTASTEVVKYKNMVTIRLSRFGRKKAPFYRIVATDNGKRATGGFLEILGTWNPAKNKLKLDLKRVQEWIAKGAQKSATVKSLIEKQA